MGTVLGRCVIRGLEEAIKAARYSEPVWERNFKAYFGRAISGYKGSQGHIALGGGD